ncbi:MAG TPA: WD40 repeat domain-containing protein, partial [Urbifossiella sp.]|nr:WD40 repeat domain-containing protein [Urbifossiella sp.]
PLSAAAVAGAVAGVRAAAGGAIPPQVTALLRAAGRPRRTLLLAPVAAALVAVGIVFATGAGPAADPPPAANPPAAAAPGPPLDRLGDPLPAGAVTRLGTRRFLGPHESPFGVAFSPDGTRVATTNYRSLTVLDAATGRALVERTDYWVSSGAIGWRADGTGVAVLHLSGHSFISAFTDPAEMLPNPPPAPPERDRAGPDGLRLVALSPDATRLAVVRDPNGSRFTIDVLPATVGRLTDDLRPLRTLGPFRGPCREVRFTTRGVQFLTGTLRGEDNWTLTVVDPDRNIAVRTTTLPPPAYFIYGFMYSLSADGRLAALPVRPKTVKEGESFTNAHDGTLRVWDLDAGKELASLPFPHGGYGTGHTFTPDGKRLIASAKAPYIRVWDVGTGKELAQWPGAPSQGEASVVAVSPDGKRLATARRDGRIDLWDAATLEPVIPLDTHRDGLRSVAVSPDGRLTATLGLDHAVRVWDTATGRQVQVLPAPGPEEYVGSWPQRRVVFTPDGGLLFTAAGVLALADPVTGRPRDLPAGLRGCKDAIGGFSADGTALAMFTKHAATVWDWPAGTVRVAAIIPPVRGEPAGGENVEAASVSHVRLSPDGRLLYTNSTSRQHGQNGTDV